MFGKKKPPASPTENEPVLHCSFCNKSQRYVRKLIAGPNVYICDECVDICLDIIREDRKDATPAWPRSTTSTCTLCRLPVAIAEAILVESRGLICPGCIGEIEAAIAREKLPR
jgi:hypothetical protein